MRIVLIKVATRHLIVISSLSRCGAEKCKSVGGCLRVGLSCYPCWASNSLRSPSSQSTLGFGYKATDGRSYQCSGNFNSTVQRLPARQLACSRAIYNLPITLVPAVVLQLKELMTEEFLQFLATGSVHKNLSFRINAQQTPINISQRAQSIVSRHLFASNC